MPVCKFIIPLFTTIFNSYTPHYGSYSSPAIDYYRVQLLSHIVHSIGYDNEYEIASREDLRELARGQMEALSRDIRNNFGDYQLATFSDIDA
ncbi:hypothetical protein Tcan_01987 [Toxocara canis]|uniref:Uncharacterized protein n=1 Tax=Toxocara canis TaxID=6265 RepID=A0A0B2VDF1_TOXCA|nr:hypothetical protein Tcan_01987 [Toxocara canis]